MAQNLRGLHHVSAITATIADNMDFYTRILGMRLVKKTVNQDDVSSYHVFYADGLASPGTDLTFFDIPHAAREHPGTHSITHISLRVAGRDALAYWKERLNGEGIGARAFEQAGRPALAFADPEGQRLVLVEDGGRGEAHPWDRSPVPPVHQIRGLGPVTISVPDLARTEPLLTGVLNMRRKGSYAHPDTAIHQVHVCEMGEGGPDAELHVAVQPDLPRVKAGAGGVHHVAFNVGDAEQLTAWAERIAGETRLPNSGEVERYYFRSFYFREPSGVLFELATDGPGFTADEPLESLGERLALPPFLEPRRAEIEAGLKPI
ncbi:ring-cleaving dioxygenase [Terrihabitans sp. B22-R8]|uniref:ring-cleaving dioxygenase n=1 Tax=Terrihabitans sp. B22-R8 TaxID=3425128 RepID=UPI00403D4853